MEKLKKYRPEHIWVEKERYYSTPLGILPGVTTILSDKEDEGISRWKARVGEKEAERIRLEACKRGRIVHAAIESKLLNKPLNNINNEIAEPYLLSLEEVFKTIQTPLLIEGAVWYPHYYAGTVDCVVQISDGLYIVDWKTSTKPKKVAWIENYFLQIAAYTGAVNFTYPNLNIKGGLIAIALPDRPAQLFQLDYEQLREYWKKWLNRVEEYHKKRE